MTKKQTRYTINTSPTQTREIAIRGRRKPRKARLALIRRFNGLIKSGLLPGPRFDAKGNLIEGGMWNRIPTQEEMETVNTIAAIISEPHSRAKRPGWKPDPATKFARAMLEHERHGQFRWLHPSIEISIFHGKDTIAMIDMAERMNRKRLPELRQRVQEYQDRRKLEKNIRNELRYFEQLLKDRKQTEMTIDFEHSQWDATLTVVRLTKDGIERETVGTDFSLPVENVMTITLSSNGKITAREVIRKKTNKKRN